MQFGQRFTLDLSCQYLHMLLIHCFSNMASILWQSNTFLSWVLYVKAREESRDRCTLPHVYIYIKVYKNILCWPFSIFLCCIYLNIHYFITCYHHILFTTNIDFVVLVCYYHKLNCGSRDNHSIYICWHKYQLTFPISYIIILAVMYSQAQ